MQITARYHQLGVALLRVVVGVIFLWAGLSKVLASGPDGFTAAGFLQFATGGTLGWPFVSGEIAEGTIFNPTHDFWVALAGNQAAMTVIDFLVPWGQIAIGISLMLGLLTRLGASMGALQMFFFFIAAWEFEHGIVNQHLTYMVICLALAGLGAGKYYGLDAYAAERVGPGVRRWLMSGDPVPLAA